MTPSIKATYPLSPMQQGILFHSLSAASSGVYVAQVTSRLPRGLRIDAFVRAWQTLLDRHDALRTSFEWAGVEPLQNVHQHVRCPLYRYDWRATPAREVEGFLESERERGFDLAKAPLMRMALGELPDGEHLFVWTHHHIVLDGRARVVLLKELALLYSAYCEGHQAQLPPPPVYREYIEWLRRESVDDEEFWGGQLGRSCTPVSFLGPSTTLTGSSAHQGASSHPISLTSELQQRLRRVARSNDVTVNILIQAAWAVLLSRYTGESSVVFGATRSCRRAPFDGIANLVGVVMNTLPHRVDVDGNRRFADVLADLRAQHVAIRKHQQTSLLRIRQWIGLEGSMPLFDTVVVFEEQDLSHALEDEQLPLWRNGVQRTAHTHYGVTLAGYSKPTLRLELSCDPHVCSGANAQRLGRQLATLLEGIAADVQTLTGELQILSTADREQILEKWNDTSRPVPNLTVPELFERQARRTPAALAVTGGARRLTYAELNAEANRLAHLLIDRGIGPEKTAAVAIPRSPELVVALLATLKAGGVYLPVDVHHPPDRVASILADAAPVCLVSSHDLPLLVPGVPGIVLGSAASADALSRSRPDDPGDACRATALTPQNLAYVVFTSGSTGLPKGVGVTHESIVNQVSTLIEFLEINETTRFAATSTVTFDILFDQILCPLLAGGTCVIVPDAVRDDSDAVGRYARVHGVTVLFGVPSAIQHLLSSGDIHVDTLLVGGEVFSGSLAKGLREARTARRILNMYGPTEACISATAFEVGSAETLGVPIGSALPNYRLYVLDARMSPVAVGMPGELYVAGPGIARGYVNRPALTAERFVADIFGPRGARMYRTGDRVRWRDDGNLEFLGRVDRQVKIRGARIEPGEIESLLEQHSAVDHAVVRPGVSADDVPLTAYVVTAKDAAPSEDELAAFLVRRLPPYMIPGSYVFLESLPLTRLGKIDVNALPGAKTSRVPPRVSRSPEEDMLCDLFAEVLGVERVEVDANFFALGGHSLHATRLATRIRSVFGTEVPVSAVFEAPTPTSLAKHLRSATRVPPPLNSQRQAERGPLSYAQQRLWFIDRLTGPSPEYNVTIALRLRGHLDQDALKKAIRTIVSRHEVLRTTFPVIDGEPVQVVAPRCDIPFPIQDLRGMDESAQATAVASTLREEQDQAFDLARDPLIRTRLLQCGPDDHVLVRTVHHVIADGWSLSVFNRELDALYAAFREGLDDPLPPLPVQYADFALWQRAWLESGALGEGLAYWGSELAGMPDELSLPADRSRPPRRTFAARQHDVVVPRELLTALKALSHDQNATLFMTLLTGLAVLLARYSGNEDMVIGSPIANRQDPKAEGLIGCFVNTLPLRVRVPRRVPFTTLLQQVRRTTLDAYRNQDVPFERIVQHVVPRRSLSTTPIFQVMLLVQNAPSYPPKMAGLVIASLPGAARVHCDLELYVREGDSGLELSWVYNAALFEPWRIDRMAEHYQLVLRAAAEHPATDVSSLMRTVEAERPMRHGATPALSADTLTCIQDAFDEWVRRTPDAVAVLGKREQVTYRELNDRASRLAHLLEPVRNSVVGVAMTRSPSMVAALLAVMRAGAAYLPLDPSLPTARLKFFIEDAGVSHVLTDGSTTARMRECTGRVLDVDDALRRHSSPRCDGLPISGSLDDLAYVIYTSGSTGVPKAVAVSQRSLANVLADMRDRLAVTPASRTFAVSNLSFDITAIDLFLPLTSGASCWLAGAPLTAGTPILRELAASNCSIVQTTPSGWRALLDLGWRGDGRVTAISTAEPLPASLADELVRTSGSAWNMYGPTETTIWSMAHRLERGDRPVPIGRPVAGTNTYVLDSHLEPVPVGAFGELFIGGAGLARGYLNRPAATATAFVANPFAATGGERLYRTGDLVRQRSTGVIEFVGRRDHQVKVRGFRIELGEIETALAAQPGIQRAVVVARTERPEDVRLVAYVVPDGDLPAEPRARSAELQQALRERLPDYMVPTGVVWLSAMPLTGNGKIDRAQLPAPDAGAAAQGAEPETLAEQILGGIWREVLGCASVGRYDDFFELGGHSLAAMQVTSRVSRDFGVELPVDVVFDRPTLADLAGYLATCTSRISQGDSTLAAESGS